MEDGESVLLDVRTRRYYSLNDTGSSIWKLAVEGADEDSIAAALTNVYDIEYSGALQEVRKFVTECATDGLMIQKATES